jgi:hypothetical protein
MNLARSHGDIPGIASGGFGGQNAAIEQQAIGLKVEVSGLAVTD